MSTGEQLHSEINLHKAAHCKKPVIDAGPTKVPAIDPKKKRGGGCQCVSQVKECDNDKVAFISAKALSAMQRRTCGRN